MVAPTHPGAAQIEPEGPHFFMRDGWPRDSPTRNRTMTEEIVELPQALDDALRFVPRPP